MVNFRMFSSMRRNKCQPGIVVYACDSSGRLRHKNYLRPSGQDCSTLSPKQPPCPYLLAFSPYSPCPQGNARLLSICVFVRVVISLVTSFFDTVSKVPPVESTLGSALHSSFYLFWNSRALKARAAVTCLRASSSDMLVLGY